MRNALSTILWMCSLGALTLAIAIAPAHAQTGAGSGLSGRVADPSGASMAGVNVTVARPDAGFVRATTTNSSDRDFLFYDWRDLSAHLRD